MLKFAVFLLCIQLGYGYPEGAPGSACDSMMPEHGVLSQQCQANYLIQAEKTEFNGNDVIRSEWRENTFSSSDFVCSSYCTGCDQYGSFQRNSINCEE